MEWSFLKNEFTNEANKKIAWLEQEYGKLKSGRANIHLFDSVRVNSYGYEANLNEVANVQIVDAKQILIKPYDKSQISDINQGILKANLGLTPQINGDCLRIIFPSMTEETRRENVKKAKAILETAKSQIRNVRQDVQSLWKKDKTIPEDDQKYFQNELDKITKEYNAKLEAVFEKKEKELMSM